jgi:hypothetical protein
MERRVSDFMSLAKQRYGLTQAIYSVRSLCEVLDIGDTSARELLKSGKLPSFLLGSKRVVAVADLAKFLHQRETATEAPVKATLFKTGHPHKHKTAIKDTA